MTVHLTIALHGLKTIGARASGRQVPHKWRFYFYRLDKPDPGGKPCYVSAPDFDSYDAALTGAQAYAQANGYTITEGDC